MGELSLKKTNSSEKMFKNTAIRVKHGVFLHKNTIKNVTRESRMNVMFGWKIVSHFNPLLPELRKKY